MKTLTLYLTELQFEKLQRLALQEGQQDVLASFAANLIEESCDQQIDEDLLEEG